MKKQIPVYKISEVQKTNFRIPRSATLRWLARLPESPFGDDYWPVFHDGGWHWLKTPPLLGFSTGENS